MTQFFGREVVTPVSPDEAIALGAGVRAAQLAGVRTQVRSGH